MRLSPGEIARAIECGFPNNIKGIRIMTYGYNAELVGANTGRLLDHRRDLIQQIESARRSPEVVTVVRLFSAG